MFKQLLQKIIGSVSQSKHSHRRHSGSDLNRNRDKRHTSGSHSGYDDKHQGRGYYKNKNRSSSS